MLPGQEADTGGCPPSCRYSHTPPLHDVHVVLGAGIVAVCAQRSPEVGPQPPMAGHQWGDDVPEEGSASEGSLCPLGAWRGSNEGVGKGGGSVLTCKHLPGAGPGGGFGPSDAFSLPRSSQEQGASGGWLRWGCRVGGTRTRWPGWGKLRVVDEAKQRRRTQAGKAPSRAPGLSREPHSEGPSAGQLQPPPTPHPPPSAHSLTCSAQSAAAGFAVRSRPRRHPR